MTATLSRVPEDAEQLLNAVSAVPAGHPSRAALRERAIEAWLPLARHLAARYTGRGEPTDDLIKTATVGLIKAVDRYDPARGVEFTAFAIPTVLGEIKRHFRDRTWSIRVPRRLQELRLSISTASATLGHTLGRSPTVTDIAAHLGVTEEEVLEGLEGAQAYSTTSLATPVGPDGDLSLGDTLGSEDHDLELAELRIALGPAIAALGEREQRILALRFSGNLTQSEIAERMGISQMHVSRLITRALAVLRGKLS
jgi:RNA polymerase sigma-B factor